MTKDEFLDHLKATHGLASDSELARVLGVDRQKLTYWRGKGDLDLRLLLSHFGSETVAYLKREYNIEGSEKEALSDAEARTRMSILARLDRVTDDLSRFRDFVASGINVLQEILALPGQILAVAETETKSPQPGGQTEGDDDTIYPEGPLFTPAEHQALRDLVKQIQEEGR